MIDWGAGQYEHTAAELEPVAEHVVSLAGLQTGQTVLDLATGTGNAALLAARAGAVVTGLDAAPRLIEVARERAAMAGLQASVLIGDVQALPLEDGAFDRAISVFGLIFAPDPGGAVAELIRVLAPGGRGLLSVWVPAGPVDAMVSVFGRSNAQVTGVIPNRFPWHDATAVGELAERSGATVSWHEGRLRITAASPEAYLSANERTHPMSLAARPLLERARRLESVREQALAILRDGNESRGAFPVTSPYRVIELRL